MTETANIKKMTLLDLHMPYG